MFERFTESARRVMVLAQEEARTLGHPYIGTEHLLLGLLHAQSGVPAQVLGAAGVTLEAARTEVAEIGPASGPPAEHIPFTPRAKKVLELSLREALELRQGSIRTEHILLALLREDGVGARILQRLGGPLPALRRRVLEAARAAPPDPGAEWERGRNPWTRGWGTGPVFPREARFLPQTVIDFRTLLTPVERRLAGIERHLGIAAAEEPVTGFHGLVTAIVRHVANIERHLGIAAGDAAAEPGEAPGEPGAAAGEPGGPQAV